jgi:UDP-N-acetylglucosamine--N-acetylmuramyl-(pentapeptide) pyrophosphoryl-undecaprenol N-acetylglucosamine transferase
MDRFFPAEKIVLTGNPTRKDMVETDGKKDEGISFYNLDPTKKTILIIGGSLGARTLNESVVGHLSEIPEDIQIIWQCGKLYHKELERQLKDKLPSNVKMLQFIERMDLAYSVADVVISRAGAISVSELCLVHKPTILVPSPNVAEDHQTKNAMALVKKNAAILVKDVEAKEKLMKEALDLVGNEKLQKAMILRIAELGKPNATKDIVNELEKLLK